MEGQAVANELKALMDGLTQRCMNHACDLAEARQKIAGLEMELAQAREVIQRQTQLIAEHVQPVEAPPIG